MKLTHYITIALLLFGSITALGAELTLQDCRTKALEANQKLQISDSELSAAQAMRKASFTAFLPGFSTIGSYTRMNERFRIREDLPFGDILSGMAQANPALTSDPFFATLQGMVQQGLLPDKLNIEKGQDNNFLLTVQMMQPLFTGGKIYHQYEIAKSLEAVAKDRHLLTRSQIILDTDEAYWRVLSINEKLSLAKQYKNLVQQHLSDLENAYEVGIITQNEILKAQVKLNEADLNILKADGGLKLARMALNQIIGQPLTEELELSAVWQPANPNILDDEAVETAISQRPEFAMLKENAKISKSVTAMARSTFYPNLALQANYHTVNPNPYNNLEAEFGSDWQIGVVMQMDIFHFGERTQRVKAAKANAKTADLQLEETKQMLELQVHQTINQYQEACQSLVITESALNQADENLRVCQDRFDAGMLRSSELLDAQIMWQNAHSNWIEAKTEVSVKSSSYQKAIGEL